MNLVEELKWRGLYQDSMPGTEEQLLKEVTSAYIGFDPTADSLHIGSLVQIILLVHLKNFGHRPVALVGGATGMIGDPSGKSDERNLLNEESLAKNVAGIKSVLSRFLNFDETGANAPKLVNNYDWMKDFTFIDFARDIGKRITVNYMMAKDSVKKRFSGEGPGMSFTEFTYQLIQGYDFYYLYKNENCLLQMGGSDQWGNITTGTELIRRMGEEGAKAYAMTTPLITKADGTKFGKTEGGNIWLDTDKTSEFTFYQFWLNTSDIDAEKYIKVFTFLEQPIIEALIQAHQAEPHLRLLQKRLAEEVTTFVHGAAGLATALETTAKLFNQQNASADTLSIEDLEHMDGILKINYDVTKLAAGLDLISFLAESGIFASKGEARKLIQNGGLSINREKVGDVATILQSNQLLHDQYLLIQKGKKQYYLVKFA